MNTKQPLSDSRSKIDVIDTHILDLLTERNKIVQDVIETKIKNRLPIFVPKREDEKIESFREMAKDRGLDPEWAEDFLRMIMSASRASQSSNEFPMATEQPKNYVIIGGNGEMGRLFARIIKASGHRFTSLDKDDWNRAAEICKDADVVIVSVPIYLTHDVIRAIAPFLNPNTILCDFTSTKNGLLDVMLSVHSGPVVSLHPMHGPDLQNLSKQLLLVLDGRGNDQYEWLIKQFELWGMRIKVVNPTKHDHAMNMIQGLRHFVALLHGSFMRAYDLKPEDILDFSSPIYHAELMMTGRIFAQDARLYADIVFSDEERRKLLRHFFDHHFILTQLVETGDKEGFINEFNAISEFFGNFADQALKESGYLIHRLAERFS